MSTATASHRNVQADPILSAYKSEQERQKEIDDLIKKREPLVVTLTKQKTEFEKIQSAVNDTEAKVGPINERLQILLGVNKPAEATPPAAAAPAPKHEPLAHAAGKGQEQSPMHKFITQAIIDNGPMTKPEITAAIVKAGFKSNAKDLGKVVAQTIDFDSKQHERFAVKGEKLPRGTKYTLGKKNEGYDLLPADHR